MTHRITLARTVVLLPSLLTVLALGACGGSGSGDDAAAPPVAADDEVGVAGNAAPPDPGDPTALDAPTDGAAEEPAASAADTAPEPASGPTVIDLVNGYVNTALREYDADGALAYESRTLIEPDQDRLAWRGEDYEYPDPLGYPEVYSGEHYYDERGQLVRSVSRIRSVYDYDEIEGTTTTSYEHDDLGRLLRFTRTDGDGSDTVTELDWDGLRLVSASDRAGLPGGFETRYRYEGDDDAPVGAVATAWYEGDADLFEPEIVERVLRRSYERDPEGRLVRESVEHGGSGRDDYGFEYEYDDAGNVVRLVRTDPAGVVLRTTEYDWAPTDERVFNRWLRIFRFFP